MGRLTDVSSVSNGAFNMIAAPWYRSKISHQEIKEAVNILNQIINGYKQKNMSHSSLVSIERIMIRRLIFRLNLKNVCFILANLSELNIPKIYFKFISEAIVLLKEFIFSIGSSPRVISPSGRL